MTAHPHDATREHLALGADIVSVAVLRGTFRLRSGVVSTYYIDKYLLTTRPDILRRLAAALAERLPYGVQRLAGPVLGAGRQLFHRARRRH